jgi:hypothetical protein
MCTEYLCTPWLISTDSLSPLTSPPPPLFQRSSADYSKPYSDNSGMFLAQLAFVWASTFLYASQCTTPLNKSRLEPFKLSWKPTRASHTLKKANQSHSNSHWKPTKAGQTLKDTTRAIQTLFESQPGVIKLSRKPIKAIQSFIESQPKPVKLLRIQPEPFKLFLKANQG